MIAVKKYYLLLFFISVMAWGSEDPCNTSDGGFSAGYMCMEKKIDTANKKLNHSYNIALTRIRKETPELEVSFQTAQINWLKYKDAQCKFTGESSTDSPWQGVQTEICQLRMILERTDYLDEINLP